MMAEDRETKTILKNGSANHSKKPQFVSLAPPQKSIFITYLLWLFGGWFGAHHLYLGRDLQAFTWWSTFGGFGIGWLVEFFQIPSIVRDVNEDPSFIEQFVHKLRTQQKPEFSTSRFLLGIMVGFLWSQLILLAIPQESFGGIDWSYLHWLTPLGGALGKTNSVASVQSTHSNF